MKDDPLGEADFAAEEISELDRLAAHFGARYDSTAIDFFDAEQTENSLRYLTDLTSHSNDLRRLIAEIRPESMVGPYRIIRFLACGGMGVVFQAEHSSLRRNCALKVVCKENVAPEFLRRFQHEMQSVAKLDHKHIVAVYDAGETGDYCYFAMELLNGQTLTELVESRGPLPVPVAAAVALQIAEGLVALHKLGMVHRDVKPANIMLVRTTEGISRNGYRTIAKLLDLGLVKSVSEPQSTTIVDSLTHAGTIIGTIDYMGPEQASGLHAPHPAWDFQALGLTLWFLTTGKPPLAGRVGTLAKLSAISSGLEQELLRCAEVPKAVRPIIKQLLQGRETFDYESLLRILGKTASSDLLEEWLVAEPSTETTKLNVPPQTLVSSQERLSIMKLSRSLGLRLVLGITALVLLFGGYWLTNVGQVIVHADSERVTLSVKQGDELILESIEITGGKRTIKLRVGEYRIEVAGRDTGEFKVEKRNVSVARNSVQTLHVMRKASNASISDASAGSGLANGAILDEQLAAVNELIELGAEILPVGSAEPLNGRMTTLPRLWSLRLNSGTFTFSQMKRLFEYFPQIENSVWLVGLEANREQFQDFIALPAFAKTRHLTLELAALTDPGDLTFLVHLEGIGFQGTKLSRGGFASLAKLKSLTHLSLLNTGAQDVDLREIRGLELSHIWLDANPSLSNAAIVALVNPETIQLLSADDTGLADQGLEHLSNAQRLNALSICGTRISDTGLQHLETLPLLKTLSLSRTTVSATGLKPLQTLPLNALWLDDCSLIDDEAAGIVARMPSLTQLSLGRTSITSAGVSEIARLPNLRELFLTGLNISPENLTELGTRQNLRRLYLWNCGASSEQVAELRRMIVNCEIYDTP